MHQNSLDIPSFSRTTILNRLRRWNILWLGGKASLGKRQSIWWGLWVQDFMQLSTAMELLNMVICFDFRRISVVTSCGLVSKAVIHEPQGQWFNPWFILATFNTVTEQDTEPQVAHCVCKLLCIKASDKCKYFKPLNFGHHVLNQLYLPSCSFYIDVNHLKLNLKLDTWHIISEAKSLNRKMCNYTHTLLYILILPNWHYTISKGKYAKPALNTCFFPHIFVWWQNKTGVWWNDWNMIDFAIKEKKHPQFNVKIKLGKFSFYINF